MIPITINDQALEVAPGTTVLNAARSAGIEIPTLCDHPAVKPYGGCRLCVVEVEGIRTLQASCTLPVFPNMVVRTQTPKVHDARRFILSMIFSERNHFCMFCQKTDGDCELQNAAYDEEMTHWPIQPNWNTYPLDTSHPYIALDHNRCILCRRCVRACTDLVGNATLDIQNRGANSFLVADYGLPWGESSCIRCGTCAQICPTGAMIDIFGAYISKDVEGDLIPSVCLGCSLGCEVELLVRDNQLVRVNGRWEAALNEGLLCEIGRYESIPDGNGQRFTQPLIRENGVLTPATWEQALEAVKAHLQPLKGQNSHGVAALASTRLSVEALSAFKQLFADGLGSQSVTAIEEGLTAGAPELLAAAAQLEALKAADVFFVAGADLKENHQVAGFFIKRNLLHDSRLILVDIGDNALAASANLVLRPKMGADAQLFDGLQQALQQENPAAAASLAETAQATGVELESLKAAVQMLHEAARPAFVYGKGITRHRDTGAQDALHALAAAVDGALFNPKGKANSLAAACLGLTTQFKVNGHQAVFMALGDDLPSPKLVAEASQAPFLVVQASYPSDITECADVVLPVGVWTEQDGHYLNAAARLQAARRITQAPKGVRSNVAVLSDLAVRLECAITPDWQSKIVKWFPENRTA